MKKAILYGVIIGVAVSVTIWAIWLFSFMKDYKQKSTTSPEEVAYDLNILQNK